MKPSCVHEHEVVSWHINVVTVYRFDDYYSILISYSLKSYYSI